MRKLGFVNTARLAAIVVPFACLALLVFPIFSVLVRCASFPIGVSRASVVHRSPLGSTRGIAEMMLVCCDSMRWSMQWLMACRAWHFYRFVVWVAFAFGIIFALPFVSASTIAKMKFSFGNPIWLSLKWFSAVITNRFDVCFAHKKCPLLVVDRVLVEGIRTLTRGIANNSSLRACGQQLYALDTTIIHKIGAFV